MAGGGGHGFELDLHAQLAGDVGADVGLEADDLLGLLVDVTEGHLGVLHAADQRAAGLDVVDLAGLGHPCAKGQKQGHDQQQRQFAHAFPPPQLKFLGKRSAGKA